MHITSYIQKIEDKVFKIALIVSFAIHAIVLFKVSYSNTQHFKRPLKDVEISYYNMPVKMQKSQAKSRTEADINKNLTNNTGTLLKKDKSRSQFMKDVSKMMTTFKKHKKSLAKVHDEKKKHKVLVPALKSEEIKIPEYQSYYQQIRDWIKKRALENVDFSKLDTGDVYLTFVVSASGLLKQIRIVEERTKASAYLRDISLDSVREASLSFSPFPKDLEYPELPFNVVISFQLDED